MPALTDRAGQFISHRGDRHPQPDHIEGRAAVRYSICTVKL